jgi:transposase
LTTKIHLLADALGRPLRLLLTPGQAADIKSAPLLLEGVRASGVIADKGYDSNALRLSICSAGMKAVIPSNRTRKVIIPHDPVAYRTRNCIERCFNKLKHYRRIATRFDRRDCHFMAFLHFACALLWMR